MRDERTIESCRRFITDEADGSRAGITVGRDVIETTLHLGVLVGRDNALRRTEQPPARTSIRIRKIERNNYWHARNLC